ncbi:MAG: pirin family protein [Deltaproteobacteria bacterium]|nr:pirin family protein [Deltaproteobacteria bacterium]
MTMEQSTSRPTVEGVSPVLDVRPLGFPWETSDPFLFCVHHDDKYPAGTEKMGPPPAMLAGRRLGMDFEIKDGFRMYHGEVVPGFPGHPHRGFETVTIVRRGLIDHSDSLGATARFGGGDVQWLTAGAGIVHSEMFPLVERERPNPLELFQIWLNLPAEDKLVQPHFAMLWRDEIPTVGFTDDAGRETRVTVVAGTLGGKEAPSPPPRSWAKRADTSVAIWCIRMPAGAKWTLPATEPGVNRNLYFFAGPSMRIADLQLDDHAGVRLRSNTPVELVAGDEECELLLLQGRPIAQPVVQHGPFVMNTREEIQRAFADYQRTRFGGWPFASDDPVHPREKGRFAKHADGKVEEREG